MFRMFTIALFALFVSSACEKTKTAPSGEAPKKASAVKTTRVLAKSGEPEGRGASAAKKAKEGPEGHDCTHGHHSTPLSNDKVTTRKGPKGETIVHAGNEFAKDVKSVTVAELLKKPDAFKGQKVQVEGNVAAACRHRRGWFAITSADKSGAFIRVITRPTFLVPTDAIGKTAQAQGTVEVVEVNQATARYFAKNHKLGDGAKIAGAQKRVVLRASGAEFI